MQRPSRFLAAIAAVLILVAPSSALAAGVTVDRSYSAIGVLEVIHADDFSQRHALYWYNLKTKSGTFKIDVGSAHGPTGAGGATVRVTGTRLGRTIVLDKSAPSGGVQVIAAAPSSQPRLTRGAAAPVAAPVAKRVAVVLINFSNDTSQPYTPAAAQDIVFDNDNSVANFMTEEARGRITFSGDVFGWFTIAATNEGCAWQTWWNQAQAAVAAAGIDLNAYTNVAYAWPRAGSCGWAGLGYMPGKSSFNNGAFSLRVVAHELSHNFGVAHASTYRCMDGVTPVSLSASCTFNEYGDPFTIMGAGSRYHNQSQQVGELGWLAAGEVVTATPGATYELAPLLGGEAGRPKALRVARGDGTWLYLEVRAPAGAYFDDFAPGSPVVSGISIRMTPSAGTPTNSPVNSRLIDANPLTATFSDAPLAVGATLTDPLTDITITTVSINADGAIVAVGTEAAPVDVTAPSAPSSLTAPTVQPTKVKLTWGSATDDTGVTGYRVSRNGTVVANLSGTTWTDTSVKGGTTYTYQVSARDGAGNWGPSAQVTVMTKRVRSAPVVRGIAAARTWSWSLRVAI